MWKAATGVTVGAAELCGHIVTVHRRPASGLSQVTNGPPSESLPACCEAWIAEQTRGWAAQQRGR
jgi:hypothetical protein